MPLLRIAEAGTSRKSQPTVLIVDDEPAIATTLSLILQSAGYKASIARTGEEAVEQAKISPPDVLVCDIILPRTNGVEAAREIRALCPECQIILITGNPLNEELRDKIRTSEFEVMTKPFHPTELIEKLRERMAADTRREKPRAA